MKPNYSHKLILVSFILLFILACNVFASIPTATPVPPTATPVPLSQHVTLISAPFNETNQTPRYTITSQTPQLAGSDDPRVGAFNQRLNELVTKEVDTFRQSFLQNTAPPVTEMGSTLDVTYTLVSQIADIWSLKLDFSFYSDGAAHPGLYSRTVNYDLGQGKELALGDLFLPNSNYLEVISNYCIAELSKQPFFEGPFREGAQPTPENYRNWNIAKDSLMITFDEYQVAPYAAGPHTISVPYSTLQAIIDPQGPLAKVSH
ncbi:MAG TPA: RsiV family protein [Anaerolineales bacterium]|nr:RsiV family protein [Anaerolineales bacterium]